VTPNVRDIRDAPPLLQEGGKGLVLIDFVHRQPCHVLGEGRLERYRIVAVFKECAGKRRETARLGLQCMACEKPALSCDHFVPIAVRPHEKRLDDAEAADAGNKLAKILIGAALAHVHRRDFELG
jgi:hypothetical protein